MFEIEPTGGGTETPEEIRAERDRLRTRVAQLEAVAVSEFLQRRFGPLPMLVRSCAWRAATAVVAQYRDDGRVPTMRDIRDLPSLLREALAARRPGGPRVKQEPAQIDA